MLTSKLHLTKLDCAKRQLATAIRLYFYRGDPVSIHTLASAAYSIVHNLNTHRGGAPMLKDVVLIKPEYKKFVRDKFNEDQNFFKHADRDPQKTVEFNPEASEGFIFEASVKYHELTGEKVPSLHAFVLWKHLWRPELFEKTDEQTQRSADEMRKLFTREMREQYYETMMQAANRI